MHANNTTQNRKPHGQSLVEFALLLPVLLLLILGAMDLGRLFYVKIVLTNAAREGVNYLAYYPEDADEGFVNTNRAVLLEADSSTVDIENIDIAIIDCCTIGETVEIKVSTEVNLIFNNFLQLINDGAGNFQLSSSVKMVVQ